MANSSSRRLPSHHFHRPRSPCHRSQTIHCFRALRALTGQPWPELGRRHSRETQTEFSALPARSGHAEQSATASPTPIITSAHEQSWLIGQASIVADATTGRHCRGSLVWNRRKQTESCAIPTKWSAMRTVGRAICQCVLPRETGSQCSRWIWS